ncbi:hypothetical protein PFISCL1PPCAC_22752, partial [Pristionchus fissidentatus]
DYSLNKKRRWQLREEMRERIEEVQDPHFNVRVSASVHVEDRSAPGRFLGQNNQHELGCVEYNSVSRDGQVTQRGSTAYKTRLRNFTHPENPARKVKGEKRPWKIRERKDSGTEMDDKQEFQ